MKKSIKYAGIAAATLLAVAPVAAPVVSQAANTTDTNTTDTVTDQNKQDAAVAAFGSQFSGSKAISSTALATALGTNKVLGTTQDAKAFAASTVGKALATGDVTTADLSLLNATSTSNVAISATVGNTTIQNDSDLIKYLSDDTQAPVVFKIVLNYTNVKNESVSKTYKVTTTRPSDEDQITAINAKFATPVTVPLNSTLTSTQLIATNNITLTDQDGDGVLNGGVTTSSYYYNTYKDAFDQQNAAYKYDSTSATTNVFDKAGTYYQRVTYAVKNGSDLGIFLANYEKDAPKYSISVNGNVASEGYDFQTSKDADGNVTAITFVRKVVVSNSTENWTVSSVSGVVTTKDGSSYYTLKNDDNVTVKNRALAANTAWKADKVRTDQDGNKQYRVATGEWIDANDVTFGDSATDNNNNASGLTDVQSVKGVVSVGTPGFTYLLYSKDGKLIKNRALAGGTDWKFINTAKDSDGTTYYRVATDEWVAAGNGVTVK